jgi:hypothetical protein
VPDRRRANSKRAMLARTKFERVAMVVSLC